MSQELSPSRLHEEAGHLALDSVKLLVELLDKEWSADDSHPNWFRIVSKLRSFLKERGA